MRPRAPDAMKYAITGAAGQLGSTFVRELGRRGADLVPLTHASLDLADDVAVRDTVAGLRPDVILNCAAYNAVDRAEDEAATALAVNAFGVRALARAAAEAGSVLVHYSTDFVFDGLASAPYRETDRANPRSVYGQSKLIGEWFAAAAPTAYVLRVESLFGGPQTHGSVDRIADALRNGQEARVFVDRIVSPSFVDDVVAATLALLANRSAPGLYHCVNTGAATWLDVGTEIARVLGVAPALAPVTMEEVQMRATRPRYCALSNEKLAAAGVHMPEWQDAIRRYLWPSAGTR